MNNDSEVYVCGSAKFIQSVIEVLKRNRRKPRTYSL